MSNRFSAHSQQGNVEELQVLAMAAGAHKRHSAVSARWDEGNLMRAMARLRVGTLALRYGRGMGETHCRGEWELQAATTLPRW